MSAQSNPLPPDVCFERHYKIGEIAGLWGLEYKKVQRMFINEPGVLKETQEGTLKKKRYTVLRVPESVVLRVHRRMRAN